jgi:hypothetical protein
MSHPFKRRTLMNAQGMTLALADSGGIVRISSYEVLAQDSGMAVKTSGDTVRLRSGDGDSF